MSSLTASAAASPGGSLRIRFLRKLRTIHGWIGLWGALMGLCIGFSGILLNHRSILPLPVTLLEKTSVQLPVPMEARADPKQLAAWLQQNHGVPARNPPGIKVEKSSKVLFDGRELEIPERWLLSFAEPRRNYSAEYYPGAGLVKLDKQDAGLLGTLTRLHKGSGANVLWVLLIDSIGGALILLCLSGLMLWTRLEWPRSSGLAVGLGAVGLATSWFLYYGL
jgi:hypothetical protein